MHRKQMRTVQAKEQSQDPMVVTKGRQKVFLYVEFKSTHHSGNIC